MFYLGIDVGKRWHEAALPDVTETVVRRQRVRPTKDGFAAFGERLAGLTPADDCLAHWRRTRDPAALTDAPRSGQPPVLKAAHRARLEQLLSEEPGRPGSAGPRSSR